MTSPLDRVREAVAARQRAEKEELEAILDALRAGERQADVARASGRSREHLRKLAIKHGIRDKRH